LKERLPLTKQTKENIKREEIARERIPVLVSMEPVFSTFGAMH